MYVKADGFRWERRRGSTSWLDESNLHLNLNFLLVKLWTDMMLSARYTHSGGGGRNCMRGPGRGQPLHAAEWRCSRDTTPRRDWMTVVFEFEISTGQIVN